MNSYVALVTEECSKVAEYCPDHNIPLGGPPMEVHAHAEAEGTTRVDIPWNPGDKLPQ